MLDRRAFLAGSAATVVAVGARAQSAPPRTAAAVRASIGRFLSPFVEAKDFSGLVAVKRAGEPAIVDNFGLADFGLAAPLAPTTRFGIESISKLLTVETLLALKAGGRLAVTDSLAKWIPDFPNAGAITVAMLAEHTSGISRDLSSAELDYSRPHSTKQLVDIIAKTKPVGPPGGTSNYSNNGYRVLARVLELAGGKPYGDLVRELVLLPRGMTATGEWSIQDIVPELASAHEPGSEWGSLRRAMAKDMTNYRGAASYYSTIGDLIKLVESLTAEGPAPPNEPHRVGHDGRGHGYVSLAYHYPTKRTSIVVLGNIESGLFDYLRPSLEKIIFDGAMAPVPLPDATARPGPIDDDFLGTYDLFGTPLVLGRDGSASYFVDAGDGAQPLISIGRNTLFSRLRYATLRREIVDGQPVLAWSEPSGSFTLKKKRA